MKLDKFVGLNRTVDEFRRWALSDLRSPTSRGLLAECYVLCAPGLDSEPAQYWDNVDIVLKNGKTVEVKTSAHLQPEEDDSLVLQGPHFDITEKNWAWSDNLWDWQYSESQKRWADCFVFCLDNAEKRMEYDPLDVSQWEFFVLTTFKINETFGRQKTVSAERLRHEGFHAVAFSDLASEISRVMQP